MVGECPYMPVNPDRCDYFLRFSSKVSGRLTTPAEPYIEGVYKIAKKYFGSRVHFWHEMNETGDERQWGYYDWQEVHNADKKLRELETGQEQDLQNRALEERVGETNDEPNPSSVTLPTRANLTSQPGVTGSRRTTVSRAEDVDLSDLMKSISLGNEIKDRAEGKSHVSGSPNPEPTISVNVSNHGTKIQFDKTSASPAEVALMQQIMAVALSPRTRSMDWKGNLLGLVAFDALHTALQITGLQVQVDFEAAWAQHLTGPEIAKFVLDCDESKTPVSAEVQKELQEVAAATLNDMPKPTSGMGSDLEYLVQVLQAMRQRKGGDETFKSLIDRSIEVAHGEALVMVE